MHQALYRKWRPQVFDDVCGQEHITSVLKYEAEHALFSHAYLFCGSRGTGKTTCAKILAKVVNCEHPVGGNPCGVCPSCRSIDSGAATDVLEMDAASNNGVDNIRDIRDEVSYSPSELKYRVYIIDEVHMLSASAFNALLKTLEEPPEHVVFILATTELQKLPATIISRCQRFDFRRISTDALMGRLFFIAKEEGLTLDEDAARTLARLARGGMRDAISLLELCSGTHRHITQAIVEDAVGICDRTSVSDTVRALLDKNYEALFSRVAEIIASSKELEVFWQDLLAFYRDMLVMRTTKNAGAYLDMTDHESEELEAIASRFRKETLMFHIRLLEDALFSMQKAGTAGRIVAEMTLVRMCDEALDTSPEAMLSRIAQIEEKLLTGSFKEPSSPPSAEKKESTEAQPQGPIDPKTAPAEKSTVSTPPASSKRILRPLQSWMEVVERVSRTSPMSAGFIKASRAYTTEDGRVVVQFDNAFALRMIEGGAARDQLRAALSAVLRREVGDRDLVMEEVGKAEPSSILDELLDDTPNEF